MAQKDRFEFSKIWLGFHFLPDFLKNRDSLEDINGRCRSTFPLWLHDSPQNTQLWSCFMVDPPAAPRPGGPLPIFTPSRGFYLHGTD